MKQRTFAALTYGEFQALYLEGDIFIDPSRAVTLLTGEAGQPDSHDPRFLGMLLERPELTVDEEDGVLLVEFGFCEPGSTKRLRLSMDAVKHTYALSARAHKVLSPRLHGWGVSISPPVDEQAYRLLVERRRTVLAVRGGNELTRLMFAQADGSTTERLAGLWEGKRVESAWLTGLPRAAGGGWLAQVGAYVRSEPYERGDVEFITDAWRSLEKLAKQNGQAFSFERFSTRVSEDTHRFMKTGPSLEGLLENEDFAEAIRAFDREIEQACGLSDAFTALAIYFCLRRVCVEKSQGELNFPLLEQRARALAGGWAHDATRTAVWLLGCHLGYDGLAKFVYASDGERFPWYRGERLGIQKIERPSEPASTEPVDRAVEPADGEAADETRPKDAADEHAGGAAADNSGGKSRPKVDESRDQDSRERSREDACDDKDAAVEAQGDGGAEAGPSDPDDSSSESAENRAPEESSKANGADGETGNDPASDSGTESRSKKTGKRSSSSDKAVTSGNKGQRRKKARGKNVAESRKAAEAESQPDLLG